MKSHLVSCRFRHSCVAVSILWKVSHCSGGESAVRRVFSADSAGHAAVFVVGTGGRSILVYKNCRVRDLSRRDRRNDRTGRKRRWSWQDFSFVGPVSVLTEYSAVPAILCAKEPPVSVRNRAGFYKVRRGDVALLFSESVNDLIREYCPGYTCELANFDCR